MIRPHRIAAFVILGVLSARMLPAQEARPFIRVQLAPGTSTPATVGEAVHVTVSVFSPTYFTKPAEWPDTLDMQTAVARLDQGRAENSNERVGATSYAGISHDYLVYPLAAGTVTIPPIAIVVTYALDGGVSAPPLTLTSKPISFEARLPAGADDVEQFVSGASLTLTQQFSRTLTGLKVGSAVTRTVTISATDSWSAMLPSIDAAPIDGVSVYPKAPLLRDNTADRGPRTSERVETTSYVFERSGSFALPAIRVNWWDQTAHRLRTARLPAVSMTVASAPASTSQIAFKDEEAEARAAAALARSTRLRRQRLAAIGAALAVALLLLAWFVRKFGPRVVAAVAAARRRLSESEPMYFIRLLRISRGGHPDKTYAATLAWLDRACGSAGEPATLERMAALSSDAALAREVALLEVQLFGRPDPRRAPWSGQQFSSVLWRARRDVLHTSRGREHARAGGLPPLNPDSYP